MPHTDQGVGWKDRETSQQAAVDMDQKAKPLRERAHALLKKAALTADEVAGALDEHILSIRPRVSELATDGLLEDTGQKRKGTLGKMQIVWRAKE